ncbi:hypothetical protein BGX33_004611, partial [Mortierella sp. NVP41]
MSRAAYRASIEEEEDVSASAEDWFAGYHLYRDDREWLKTQTKEYGAIARSFSAGKSFEGRDQAGLQHSREWITESVVEHLIYQLLSGTDERVAGYLKKYTFHIIPIMNPDGFIITQTTDRSSINRNWDFHWDETGGDMSSTDPCAINYRGPHAFSTPEDTNIARYLRSLPNVVAYMDIHTYGQLILTPYGFTRGRLSNYDA